MSAVVSVVTVSGFASSNFPDTAYSVRISALPFAGLAKSPNVCERGTCLTLQNRSNPHYPDESSEAESLNRLAPRGGLETAMSKGAMPEGSKATWGLYGKGPAALGLVQGL